MLFIGSASNSNSIDLFASISQALTLVVEASDRRLSSLTKDMDTGYPINSEVTQSGWCVVKNYSWPTKESTYP